MSGGDRSVLVADPDGHGAEILAVAPGSDLGQKALAVRIISALGGAGGGGPATIADGADIAQGAKADVAWVSGDGTVISILKTIASSGAAAGLTDAQLRASAVPVSGAFFQATQPVSGTFFQATQPVSLATNNPDVTDRAARLLGHVTVDAAPTTAVTGPLTDTQLRASAVPVSGTFFQATQPVSGTFFQATQPVSGTITANQGGAPWSENITQVGGSALALKALPTNGDGQAALPVWNAAIQMATYDAGARAIVTGALTANTAKAVLSIEHAAGSTKTVKIRRIIAHMLQTTALSGLVELELHRGTAASSAGTVRTPTQRKSSDPAAEAVVKSLPTIVAATVLDTFPLGGFGATTALYSPPVVVYDWQEAGETKTYVLRAGVLESFVLNVISSAAHNLTMAVAIDFTEE